jgi:Ras GTPase-activating-like protein IQGAP2/3
MANKRSSYGEDITLGRRLGHHLPRIASGDANDDWEAEEQKVEEKSHVDDEWQKRDGAREKRRQGMKNYSLPSSPTKSFSHDPVIPGVTDVADVAGIPGRLKLSRDRTPTAHMPLPSARLSRGLWADTQRHLLQAYEYLCHVGEAQQWVEGCLEQELGFGVVEMEEELRNGVVLAKLVRKFQGGAVVRRIYEAGSLLYFLRLCNHSSSTQARKLDFRHSDNINYFFVFVRQVGLPEVHHNIYLIFTI